MYRTASASVRPEVFADIFQSIMQIKRKKKQPNCSRSTAHLCILYRLQSHHLVIGTIACYAARTVVSIAN